MLVDSARGFCTRPEVELAAGGRMTVFLDGFKVGHYTDERNRTGCTVVLPPPGNVASCDVRGSSPGSRELASLDLERRLTEVHAVLLTGGSAFGLAAADGVMSWLAERNIGYETRVARVPIVPAAVIFDLAAGNAATRPGPEEGRAACDAATSKDIATGRVGAGTGATVGKWGGLEESVRGGLGIGRASSDDAVVGALAVVNAVGDVVDADGRSIAGSSAESGRVLAPRPPGTEVAPVNTVLAVVATHATVDKRAVKWLAGRGSDGVTTSVRPAHTRYDGDVCFAVVAPLEAGAPEPDLDVLGVLATQAVARAVRNAVGG
ncbi:MAG: P1 family peptidase [Actinomycetota bacterium]